MLPAICTEERITLGAELVCRQPSSLFRLMSRVATGRHVLVMRSLCGQWRSQVVPAQTNGRVIRGQNAISHPGRGAAPQAAAVVDKHAAGPPMEAPIRRIFYLSSEGTHQARDQGLGQGVESIR